MDRDLNDATQAVMRGFQGELEGLKNFGINRLELLKDMGKKGTTLTLESAQDLAKLQEAILSQLERKFSGGMETMMEKTKGRFSNLLDWFDKARKQMAEGGVMQGVGDALTIALNTMERLYNTGVFERIGKLLGDTLLEAVNKASGMLEGTLGRYNSIMDAADIYKQQTGKSVGFAEMVLTPNMSKIPAVREGAKRIGSGLKGVQANWNWPSELTPAAYSVGAMIMQGASDAEVESYIDQVAGWYGADRMSRGALPVWQAPWKTGPPKSAMTPEVEGEIQTNLDMLTDLSGGKQAERKKSRLTGGTQQLGVDAMLENLRLMLQMKGRGDSGKSMFDAIEQVPALAKSGWDSMRVAHSELIQAMIDDMDRLSTETVAKYGNMSGAGVGAFQAIKSTGVAAMTVLTAYVSKMIDHQVYSHQYLKNIATASAKQVVADAIRATGERWAAEAAISAKIAASAALSGNVAVMWDQGGRALAYGAGAALAFGTANIYESQASRLMNSAKDQFGSQLGSQNLDSGGTKTPSPVSTGGARIVEAGSAPQTVNFYVTVQYGGAVVYGLDGMRDAYNRELLPLIQESMANGQLRFA
jgi:hypothetical protein